eukprot:539376_1
MEQHIEKCSYLHIAKVCMTRNNANGSITAYISFQFMNKAMPLLKETKRIMMSNVFDLLQNNAWQYDLILNTSHRASFVPLYLNIEEHILSNKTQWSRNHYNDDLLSCTIDISSLCLIQTRSSLILSYNNRLYHFRNHTQWSYSNQISIIPQHPENRRRLWRSPRRRCRNGYVWWGGYTYGLHGPCRAGGAAVGPSGHRGRRGRRGRRGKRGKSNLSAFKKVFREIRAAVTGQRCRGSKCHRPHTRCMNTNCGAMGHGMSSYGMGNTGYGMGSMNSNPMMGVNPYNMYGYGGYGSTGMGMNSMNPYGSYGHGYGGYGHTGMGMNSMYPYGTYGSTKMGMDSMYPRGHGYGHTGMRGTQPAPKIEIHETIEDNDKTHKRRLIDDTNKIERCVYRM